MSDLTTYAQLGGTVLTVLLFLKYLTKRDTQWTSAIKDIAPSNIVLAKSLQKLTDVVQQNNVILHNNLYNRKENTAAVKENSDVIAKTTDKVAEVLKTNGNGH